MQDTELILYNPIVVFYKISITYTKSDILSTISIRIRIGFFSGQIPQTPKNIEQIKKVDEFISLFGQYTLDIAKLTLLYITLKGIELAIIDCIVLNCINTKL